MNVPRDPAAAAADTRDELLHRAVGLLPRRALTAVAGHAARIGVPRAMRGPLWRGFSAAVGAHWEEAARPPSAYATFEEFFMRELRPEAREFESDCLAASPCDGVVEQIGTIEDGRVVQAKGVRYDVDALLGSSRDGAAFRRGVFATIYLSPRDYHRVHAPFAFAIDHARHCGGDLWPVNGRTVSRVDRLFATNERVALVGSTGGNAAAVVLVGALVVGRIQVAHPEITLGARRPGESTLSRLAAPWEAPRGAELGAFGLGSTVVVLLADPRAEPLREHGQRVRAGDALWARDGGRRGS